MTDNELIKALECCSDTANKSCKEKKCPAIKECMTDVDILEKSALYLINRQKAEIERLQKLQKPTKTSGFKIELGKVVFYTHILNGYRHEYANLDEVVKELNLMLQQHYSKDVIVAHYKSKLQTAKSEAYKDFAEKLKADFVSWENYGGKYVKFLIDKLVKELTESK